LSFAPGLAAGNDGFGAGYFEQLFKVEAGNFWFRSRNKLLLWALRKYFPHAENFFEIGCGTGYVLSGIQREFSSLRLYGSDIFSNGLLFAQQRLSDVSLFQMDARRIPFEKEFDVIGAFDVLEHIDEDGIVLQQMFQATKPGGGDYTDGSAASVFMEHCR
jgi:ubiquinone/menaquinone biosynthesis C-methylase UbiE